MSDSTPIRRAPAEDGPQLEIQIHPSDIRRGVWYLFLSRKQVVRWAIGVGAYLLFVLFNLAISPWVITGLLSKQEYAGLTEERARLGERLNELTGRLAELADEGEELRTRMSRIYLAYGLSSRESEGQGGYPIPAALAPDSIYSGTIQRGSNLQAQIEEQIKVLATFLDEVQAFETENADQVRSTPSVAPLRGSEYVLTSPFGTRRSPFTKALDFHAGIDLAAPVGTPIYAPADGDVAFAGRYPLRQSVGWWRYGNLVALRNGSRFITLFGHCEEIRVRAGQKVKQGDIIATVGNTGWSTNPHLHYEVRVLDEEKGEYMPVDPRIYILDHKWRDEERLLVRARRAPEPRGFEPLPRVIGRR